MNKDRIGIAVAVVLALIVVGFIPMHIMRSGYMPYDDALRYAAKAVSGRDLSQIVILREGIRLDSSPGWQIILNFLHQSFGLDKESLISFSIIALFVFFSLIPILLLKRPEAWFLSLLILNIFSPICFGRILFGRPYLVTMAVMMAVMFLGSRLQAGKNRVTILASLIFLTALGTWIHGVWYYFIFPVLSFFMARQGRSGMRVAMALAAGIVLGALLTLHPVCFFVQSIKTALLAMTTVKASSQLVYEFRPFDGDFKLIMVLALILVVRLARREGLRRSLDNPVFYLVVLCWLSGFLTARVWFDIGMSGVLLWMALEIQDFFGKKAALLSVKRFIVFGGFALLLIYFVTNDAGGRWSKHKLRYDLTFRSSEDRTWAPLPGGIVYNNNMRIFYHMFYENPMVPWRYMVGYEPGIMPASDLAIFRNLQLKPEPASLIPWVERMRPQDRLFIFGWTVFRPNSIKKIEWRLVSGSIWVGRLKAGALYENLKRCNTYNHQGQYQAAIALARESVEKNPEWADYYDLPLAIGYAQTGRAEESIKLLFQSIAKDINVAEAYYNLGLLYKNSGDPGRAVDCFNKALESDPCFAPAYYGLGVVEHDRGEFKKAIGYYRKAILFDGANAALYNDLASACFSIRQYRQAIAYGRKAVEIRPDFASAFYNLALFYYSLHQEKEAIQFCDKAMALGYAVDPELLKKLEPYRK